MNAMPTGVPVFALLILFGAVCFAVGYAFARRAGLRRERELSKELEDAAARYRESMHRRSEPAASEESEAEQWKSAYETMVQSYDTMKEAYEGMKRAAESYEQAAESYEEASDSNRRAYEEQKAVNEQLLDAIKSHKNSAPL
jgi:Skp family chaperone for outer membrane proteins